MKKSESLQSSPLVGSTVMTDISSPLTPNNFAESGIKPQRKRKCTNRNCPTKAEGLKLERINFNNSYGYFCSICCDSVRKKWVCYFCKFICVEGDYIHDNGDWVQCDSPRCGSWTHINCEKKNGYQDIVQFLEEQSAKYYCPLCKGVKNAKKGAFENSKGGHANQEKFLTIEDLRKTMISRRRIVNLNYSYLHSENYQPIEKLVSNFDSGLSSLMLKDNELISDLKIFNQCLGRNAFEVPGEYEKSTSSRPDALVSTVLKRIKRNQVRH